MNARYTLFVTASLFGLPQFAWAGMPTVAFRLTEVAYPRLQTISFFLVGFLMSALLIMLLWNYLRKDWTFLPRLNYWRSLVIVGLWGLLFVLVLTMISGARELMTPGAWEKQGSTYRLVQKPSTDELDQLRRRQIERLRDGLWNYARLHDGAFPADTTDTAIPSELWTLPQTAKMQYRYLGGKMAYPTGKPLAHELEIYGPKRYVLYSNGDIRKLDGELLAKALEEAKQ
jgi:hypothetical protein